MRRRDTSVYILLHFKPISPRFDKVRANTYLDPGFLPDPDALPYLLQIVYSENSLVQHGEYEYYKYQLQTDGRLSLRPGC